jgi:hypothetical protein
VISILLLSTWAFKSPPHFSSSSVRTPLRLSELKMVIVDPLVSLGAGSLAGVVGIGVAYPLDSLKTKAQVYASTSTAIVGQQQSLLDIAKIVYKKEGIGGFYNGVAGVMVGEAFVKATLFGTNAWALSFFSDSPSIWQLIIAAAFSGVISSFVLNPIERVKVLMQANKSYTSEIDCITQVVQKDGVTGLLSRGLSGKIINIF